MTSQRVVFNGIHAGTGTYLTDSLSDSERSHIAQQDIQPNWHIADARARLRSELPHVGLPVTIDACHLSQTGWGAIFAPEINTAIKEALSPLLKLRREQATVVNPARYREMTYVTGETKLAFLRRHGAVPGIPVPHRLPYYLLIIGSPVSIPFDFQYQLDVQYAIGRIYFETAEEYRTYADSVVHAETGTHVSLHQATFFGTINPDDEATAASAHMLVQPLAQEMDQTYPDWTINTFIGEGATKDRLCRILGGSETPALLFSASHGVGYSSDDPIQTWRQGALLCQDWPGPVQHMGAIPDSWMFTANDLDPCKSLHGLIAILLACYSAGTATSVDPPLPQRAASARSFEPFVSHLVRQMLCHPGGGALAVVGHVDHAWSSSFAWEGIIPHHETFSAVVHALLQGYPIGAALEPINVRYAELLTLLEGEQQRLRNRYRPDELELSRLWLAKNDACGYVIIGDPAVRLYDRRHTIGQEPLR